jgi:hypothetical protein
MRKCEGQPWPGTMPCPVYTLAVCLGAILILLVDALVEVIHISQKHCSLLTWDKSSSSPSWVCRDESIMKIGSKLRHNKFTGKDQKDLSVIN